MASRAHNVSPLKIPHCPYDHGPSKEAELECVQETRKNNLRYRSFPPDLKVRPVHRHSTQHTGLDQHSCQESFPEASSGHHGQIQHQRNKASTNSISEKQGFLQCYVSISLLDREQCAFSKNQIACILGSEGLCTTPLLSPEQLDTMATSKGSRAFGPWF